MTLHNRYSIDDSKIIYDTIDGEVILVHVETGNYYQLPGVGAEVWRCLSLGLDFAQIVGQLAGKYQGDAEEIEASTRAFIDQLLSENLVAAGTPARDDEVPTAAAALPDSPAPPTPYTAPLLHKYTDLQGLLLVDPIHDVDEQGWPAIRTRQNPD